MTKTKKSPDWKDLKLTGTYITHFPMLIHETLEDWPYRSSIMARLPTDFEVDAGEAIELPPRLRPEDIKLQMVLDLWGDYQHNASYGTYKHYPDILMEISTMPIYEGECSAEELQAQVKELIERLQFASLTRYGISLLNQYLIGRLAPDD